MSTGRFTISFSLPSTGVENTSRLAMASKQFDKNFILEFINVYHGLPALWDVKSKDYTNRARKKDQYDVLIKKYREQYPDADKQDVVKKINSLRTNFRKELKRLRDANESGAGVEYVKPQLWYFEDMKFLQSQETPTDPISVMDTFETNGSPLNLVEVNLDSGNVTETDESLTQNRFPNKRIKLEAHHEELVNIACKRLQQPADENELIVAVWATQLRNMDLQQQLFAKKAINDILFEGQMGTLHRDSVEINSSRSSTPHSS